MTSIQDLTGGAPPSTHESVLARAREIAAVNDAFRGRKPSPNGLRPPGKLAITRGVASLDGDIQKAILATVATFDEFEEDDPYGEHDFGAFRINGVSEKIFWKIDVYASAQCQWGAEFPEDPGESFRILTIMLASEY